MADIEVTREKLIACLREVLPGQTHGAIPKVLGPSDGRLRKEATLPYNLRLADSIGPLALVYRECPLGVRVVAHVVSAQTAQEISAAVQCAKECKVPAVPRSGGHSYAAYSLGGELDVHTQPSDPLPLLADMFDAPPAGLDAPIPAEPSLIIDMRAFRAIEYDSQEQTVKVGAGAMTGEMCVALEKVGRMVPCGSCLTVGVGGQAVSGGFGLMSR
jgi:FAD/FMN-containing dehydrogenase